MREVMTGWRTVGGNKGAVTRSWRRAATKVTVCQLPYGTFWTGRSPCGARPWRRVIVETLSSMKTDRALAAVFAGPYVRRRRPPILLGGP
jgi:hypothetical protein